MTILEKGNFRLHTINKLDFCNNKNIGCTELPISDGIGIEKRCYNYKSDASSYYVICFVKYNKYEGSAGIEDDIHGRLLDIETNEWPLFKELYKTAKQLVETANMEVELSE